jgi:hypothetical protein
MRGKKSRSNLVVAGTSQKKSTPDTPPQSLVSSRSSTGPLQAPNPESRREEEPKIATKRDSRISRIEREMTRQKSAEDPTRLGDFAQISCTRGRRGGTRSGDGLGVHDVQRRVKRPPTPAPDVAPTRKRNGGRRGARHSSTSRWHPHAKRTASARQRRPYMHDVTSRQKPRTHKQKKRRPTQLHHGVCPSASSVCASPV